MMEANSVLSAHEIGEGLPMLFIHGWEQDGEVEQLDFEPIFANRLGYRRIYVDLPGMGATPANNVKDLDDMYLRLEKFIDVRLGKSKFLLVGTSCGGYLAQALARRYIDQIEGLLLRVPLIEPNDGLRDLDTFKPLFANEQLISILSKEDKAVLGDVLVQTPAYLERLKRKYEETYVPASKRSKQGSAGPNPSGPNSIPIISYFDRNPQAVGSHPYHLWSTGSGCRL
jgi:pimeloyl-ACP methyl ester carboxylesterase